jgi:tetratricopeptide (TPR) repeat protein
MTSCAPQWIAAWLRDTLVSATHTSALAERPTTTLPRIGSAQRRWPVAPKTCSSRRVAPSLDVRLRVAVSWILFDVVANRAEDSRVRRRQDAETPPANGRESAPRDETGRAGDAVPSRRRARILARVRPGSVIAGRYQIVELAARGGMGVVYRAVDRHNGQPVAVKVLGRSADVARFARERRILASLQHPNIVAYIDGGTTGDGAAWLVTEWIDGETLSARAARGPLDLQETLALACRIASALRAAHERGVIHRDVKPSNILLPGGAPEQAKLGDFGVARLLAGESATASGVVVGTPGYMAPEQARGAREIDPRADLFALGCVIYRCLTGSDPFCGDDAIGILVQTVLEDPAPVRQLAPHVPVWLERLTQRLLSKSADARPASAELLLGALSESAYDVEAGRDQTHAAPVGAWERVLRCFAVARPAVVAELEEVTTVAHAGSAPDGAIREAVAACGGRLDRMAGGILVATAGGAAIEQATTVARCALAMRDAAGDQVAIAVLASKAPRSPGGDLVAADARAPRLDPDSLLCAAVPGAPPRVDTRAARLLERRFELVADERGLWLSRERGAPLCVNFLGRPAPFVGREREIALLADLLAETVRKPAAHAALLVGDPGIGKSRLVGELSLRAAEMGLTIWTAEAGTLGQASPLRLLSIAIGREARIEEGEPPEQRWAKLTALAKGNGERNAERIVPFLAEIVGPRWPAGRSVELDAARANVQLMSDRLRNVVVDLLASVTAAAPLMIVLEDVHWGDAASLETLGVSLRRLADRPLLVIATARPELNRDALASWRRALHEIPIRELSRRAAERFVSEATGGAATGVVASLVEQAAGNPLWLEELTREHAEGRHGPAGETLLSMVESRLEAVRPEVRRALRAASVYGRTFRVDAVAHLLGADDVQPVHLLLREAEERELIALEAPPSSTRVGRPGGAFAFRHALFAEAAYGMLPADDRTTAHRAAAEWLVQLSDCDPLAIAEHHVRGDQAAQAVPWLRRAAERALGANDFDGALRCAGRAIECGASGEELARVRLVEAESHRWRSRWERVRSAASEALAVLPRGSGLAYRAIALLAFALGRAGDLPGLDALVPEAAPTPTDAAADSPSDGCDAAFERAIAWARMATQLTALQSSLTAEVVAWLGPWVGRWPAVDAWICEVRAIQMTNRGAFTEEIAANGAAIAAFEAIGDHRNSLAQHVHRAISWSVVGDHRRAIEEFESAFAEARRHGLENSVAYGMPIFGVCLWHVGERAAGRARVDEACRVLGEMGNRSMHNLARFARARLLLLSGELVAAVDEARSALEASGPGMFRSFGEATLASTLVATGRPHEALALIGGKAQGPRFAPGAALHGLTLARALHATGDVEGAKVAIARARDRVLTIAAGAPQLREFVLGSPDHRETLELARQWLGED